VFIRKGVLMELLYADDLVLMADTEELLVEKIQRWKEYGRERTQGKLRYDKGYVIRSKIRTIRRLR